MAITWNTGSAAARYRLKKNKKIKLKKLVRKLNKENEPPRGWKPGDRVQARKRPSLTAPGIWDKMGL
jgi:U3 small nucleolar ribonucleoprotein component